MEKDAPVCVLEIGAGQTTKVFSMKGDSIWFHYMPFVNQTRSGNLQVPLENSGKTWPSADRENTSIFATYMALRGDGVFISIELCAKDFATAKKMAEHVGYEDKNSPGVIIRLKTKHFPLKAENDLSRIVNEALDELCEVGERLTSALDNLCI